MPVPPWKHTGLTPHAYFGMPANAQIGSPTGLLANGRPVSALQMTATFLGLDAVGTLGGGAVFSDPPPDPTALFLGLVGSYLRDPLFGEMGAIWAHGAHAPDGGQLLFRVDSLTISAVPEPGAWALWLAGGLALLLWVRRYRPTRAGGRPHAQLERRAAHLLDRASGDSPGGVIRDRFTED